MTTADFAAYKQINAINWSSLKNLKKSPLHYKHARENERADNTRFARGRGCHTAVLEIERFMLEYACFDGERRAGKKWDAFEEMHDGKTILKVDEYRKCIGVREAVRGHKEAARILARGKAEQSITWMDEVTGLPCKARIDWLSSAHELADLKTTTDLDAERFGRLCARMMYHAQLAMYRDGVKAVTGKAPRVYIIPVELEPPHDVAVYEVSEDDLYAGQDEYRTLLKRLLDCMAADEWPGAHPTVEPLLLPAWAFGDEQGFVATDMSTGEVIDG